MRTDITATSKLVKFFISALQEIYWSEIHLVNVLNTMTNASTAAELKEAFRTHAVETMQHVERLEQAFQMLDVPAQPEPSAGLQGLFDEGWQVIDESEAGSAQRDVALIIAAQKVEHYEIACYGSLVTLARTLNRDDIAQVLGQTLQEEKMTDALLTNIAEDNINEEASEEPADSYKR
jgi:ferritin-like metal-binding protein YciE